MAVFFALGAVVQFVMFVVDVHTIAHYLDGLRNGLRANFIPIGSCALIGVPLTASGIRALRGRPRWPAWVWWLDVFAVVIFFVGAGWVSAQLTPTH